MLVAQEVPSVPVAQKMWDKSNSWEQVRISLQVLVYLKFSVPRTLSVLGKSVLPTNHSSCAADTEDVIVTQILRYFGLSICINNPYAAMGSYYIYNHFKCTTRDSCPSCPNGLKETCRRDGTCGCVSQAQVRTNNFQSSLKKEEICFCLTEFSIFPHICVLSYNGCVCGSDSMLLLTPNVKFEGLV